MRQHSLYQRSQSEIYDYTKIRICDSFVLVFHDNAGIAVELEEPAIKDKYKQRRSKYFTLQ